MKNLHLFKRIAVMIMAAMMVIPSFALPTFAADPVNKANFEVKGLDQASEVKAYKVVSISTGADRGATSLVVENSIKDVEKPEYSEIMALVQEAGKDSSKLTAINPTTFEGGTATFANADPGMYIVTIKNKDDAKVVYNPVVVSVNLKDGTGDAQANTFTVGDDSKYDKLTGTGAGTLKKSTIPFEKVVDRDDDKNGDKGTNPDNSQVDEDNAKVNADGIGDLDGNRGDTAGLGDTVWFRINTMVPDYANNFFKANNSNINEDPKFNIYDTLSNGLTLNKNSISLWYLDQSDPDENNWTWTEVKAADNYYTTPAASLTDREFRVELTPSGVLNLKGKKIEVRYSADVNGNHGYNYKAETNTGGFEYTRNPGNDAEKGEEKTTYHYTFTINGGIVGKDTTENREIIKIGTDDSGDFVLRETEAQKETSWRPLEGAEFKLQKKGANGQYADVTRTPAMNIYSDKDGIIRGIDQIDAGEYQLIETKAPDGFATNTTAVPFRIHATLDNDGRMTNYEVYVTMKDGNETKEVLVGDYSVTYSDTVTATSITPSNITYNNTESKNHTTPKYKLHKMVEGKYVYKNVADDTEVQVSAEDKATYDADDEYEAVMEEVTKSDFDEAANIRNSKVGTLPSTGGIGTVIFTVGGIAIMALALLLLFGGKKKEEQK